MNGTFAPSASRCAPYRARTKGKTENGVTYVKRVLYANIRLRD
jgi:transposase